MRHKFHRFFIFITFVFIFSNVINVAFATATTATEALQKAQEKGLSQSRAWKKLLHYETDFWWITESQVDSSNFFLSANGKKDIDAEFATNLESFLQDEDLSQPELERPRCRFPARFMWMKKELPQFFEGKNLNCPRFSKFFEALKGPSASLVFSSYYLNNPSSAFGHTFLRINKSAASDGHRYELLDYGVNYAANMDTDNAMVYAFRGMFGLFAGTFTSVPYYYKVREYNNAESRDLWEYELDITPEEVEMLVAHVWEVGPVRIDYWYLTENCSYHMLSILEAAAPRLHILDHLKTYIIPSDTVQVVWQVPGLVKSFHYRPSIRSEFFTRVQGLTKEEESSLQALVMSFPIRDNEHLKGPYGVYDYLETEFKKLSLESRKKVLDAAIDYMDYRYPVKIQEETPEAKRKQLFLSERSEINLVTEKLNVPMPMMEQPHLAHGSRRIGLGYRSAKEDNSSYLLQYKFALHDLLDPMMGYPEYAKISFFDIQVAIEDQLHDGAGLLGAGGVDGGASGVSGGSVGSSGGRTQSKKIWLEQFNVFEVISNSAVSAYGWPMSWQIRMGFERMKNINCWNCESGVIAGGAGYSFNLGNSLLSVGLLGHGNYVSHSFAKDDKKLFVGLGPAVRMKWRPVQALAFLAEWQEGLDLDVENKFYHEASLAAQYSWKEQWGLRITGKDNLYDQQISSTLYYYY
jgi:hypothetical protein